MARPTKQGIEYFPLDTVFDNKIELLIAEKGHIALSILITLWQMIYQNEGYYIKADKDTLLLIKKKLMIDGIEIIEEVLNAALERNIFDYDKFVEENIYTSKAVQKRYFLAAKRKLRVNVYKNYMCEGVPVYKNITICEHLSTKVKVKVKVKVKEEVKVNIYRSNGKMTEELFNEFWGLYPRKVKKKLTKQRFLKLNKDLFPVIKDKLNKWKKSKQWEDMQFIPYPSTWVNNEIWQDPDPEENMNVLRITEPTEIQKQLRNLLDGEQYG